MILRGSCLSSSSAVLRRGALTAVLAVAIMGLALVGNAAAISGVQPLVVVLCNFSDNTSMPATVAQVEKQFNESGAGTRGAFDYWKEVSYNQLDLTGTVVKGWYTVDKTVAEWQAKEGGGGNRQEIFNDCTTKADPAVDFNNYTGVVVLTNQANGTEDLFGAGPPSKINGTVYPNLGRMLASYNGEFDGILHESGHAYRFNHSRKITPTPGQPDYGDLYDVMSCLGCYTTAATYGANSIGGTGLNVVQLDTAGWIAPARITTFDNSTCTQQTLGMAALNHNEAPGFLETRIPVSVPIAISGVSTTGDRYALELREA